MPFGSMEGAAPSSPSSRLCTAELETSSLHLDVLRDLKRIHSHICSVAYPVLEAAGELQLSVIECFETDGGVSYRSDRLILF